MATMPTPNPLTLSWLRERSAIKPDEAKGIFAFKIDGKRIRLSAGQVQDLLDHHSPGDDLYLSGADLSDINLKDQLLAHNVDKTLPKPSSDADAALSRPRGTLWLDHTDLRGALLSSVDLRFAHLDAADLRGAVLVGAHLQGASLRGCNAGLPNSHDDHRGTDFSNARLHGADLTGATLTRSIFSHAHLLPLRTQGSPLAPRKAQQQMSCADLRWAKMEKAIFHAARLRGARLDNAILTGATFTQAHLSSVTFDGACLEGADFSAARFYEEGQDNSPSFVGASLEGVKLNAASLHKTKLTRAGLAGADLRGAHLQGADLTGAHVEGKAMEPDALVRIRKIIAAFPDALPPANLEGAIFNRTTTLHGLTFGAPTYGAALVADAVWGDAKLDVVDWEHVERIRLGEEIEAGRPKKGNGTAKIRSERVSEYRRAIRANRQLSLVLQEQGLSVESAHFAYHARLLEDDVIPLNGGRFARGRYVLSLILLR